VRQPPFRRSPSLRKVIVFWYASPPGVDGRWWNTGELENWEQLAFVVGLEQTSRPTAELGRADGQPVREELGATRLDVSRGCGGTDLILHTSLQ